ncbi:MAG: hypothetical protein ACR2GK_07315 [Gemmatimonadaceae bacterium]
MRHKFIIAAAALSVAATGCTPDRSPNVDSEAVAARLDSIAEPYVKLVLAVGKHDADYVDAYYGPPEWRSAVDSAPLALPAIAARADSLIASLDSIPEPGDEMLGLRRSYLRTQLGALAARVGMLEGGKLTFDSESLALYNAVSPKHPESYYQQIIDSLGLMLPGTGPIPERYERYRSQFVIPPAKLDTVFRTAIAECKARTLQHLSLPPGEEFKLEYVTGKSWSGYNWYQGDYKSLIQINTDLPIFIDRAIDLACHEGYPGHHVYNVMLEQELVKKRGWLEYTVYPLFSPQSLIAEGTANYGIEMAFPGAERREYEQRALWPLAGLDSAKADEYYRIFAFAGRLAYAGNEAARRYLDGEITAAEAAAWMNRYALFSPARAAQRVKFIDQYRSYVINYNLGKDLVKEYVEGGSGGAASGRWTAFTSLLTTPRLPKNLAPDSNNQ